MKNVTAARRALNIALGLGVALIAFALLVAWPFWNGWRTLSDLRDLDDDGSWTRGRVTASRLDSIPTSVHVGTVTRHRLTVAYGYEVDGKAYEGQHTEMDAIRNPYRVGEGVPVLYHPDRPSLSTIRKPTGVELEFSWRRVFWPIFWAALILVLLVAWLLSTIRSNTRRWEHEVRNG